MKILVTGCAGFIGYHLCLGLAKNKKLKIYGIDNLNFSHDIDLKKTRLKELKKKDNIYFKKIDILSKDKLDIEFKKNAFDIVINLAAKAGVRDSIINPEIYFENNIVGFFNIIDLSKKYEIKHFIYASTSSVYGSSKKFPTDEKQNTDEPVSFYAATKKCNEVIAHSYSCIYKIKTTGLRFFTVYGPYGRPDMAIFKFIKLSKNNKKIDLFNNGNHSRDFTYIDDVVTSIIKLINKPSKSKIPYQIFNVSKNNSENLSKIINLIEKHLRIKIDKRFKKIQKGDVKKTHGDNTKLKKYINYSPKMNIENGIEKFVYWYKNFYK